MARQIKLLWLCFVGYAAAIVALSASNFISNYGPLFAAHHSTLESTPSLILPNGRIAGGDFLCFYVAGRLFREGRADLYNVPEQIRQQEALVGGDRTAVGGVLPYVYPPLVASLFSQLTIFPYAPAFVLWFSISFILFFACTVLILRELRVPMVKRIPLLICTLGFQPFAMECLGGGQTSVLGLAIFTGIFLQLRRGRHLLAGLILSLGYYKPPLFVAFALSLLLLREWRVLTGAVIGAAVLTAATLGAVGLDGFQLYLQTVQNYSYGSQLPGALTLPPDRGMGLYALIVTLLGDNVFVYRTLFITGVIALVYLFTRVARMNHHWNPKVSPQFELSYSTAVALSLFCSPQLVNYDLTILVLPFLLIAAAVTSGARVSGVALAVVAVVGFYLEWILRSFSISGIRLNTAPFLFILLILGLFVALRRSIRVDSAALSKS